LPGNNNFIGSAFMGKPDNISLLKVGFEEFPVKI
jgi:hypothetical protein